jgi:hypothetical protein
LVEAGAVKSVASFAPEWKKTTIKPNLSEKKTLAGLDGAISNQL